MQCGRFTERRAPVANLSNAPEIGSPLSSPHNAERHRGQILEPHEFVQQISNPKIRAAAMRQFVKKIVRSSPLIFNPVWAAAYPYIRRTNGYVSSPFHTNEAAFSHIYENNGWSSAETRSGFGSSLEYTAPLRKSLEKLLRRLAVGTFLDAPCGDFNWMQHVRLPENTRYLGGDIVKPLIAQLQTQYGDERHQFQTIDIVNGELPAADLWLCRDVLFHLPTADVMSTLRNFSASRIPFILTTTYDFEKENIDVNPGGFRYINLTRPPFMLPRPQSRIVDFLAPSPPRYLALWSREQVAAVLKRHSDQ
jgi:hypothetical protein